MIGIYGIKALIYVHLATPAETHLHVFRPHIKNSIIAVFETFNTCKGCCIWTYPNKDPHGHSLRIQSNTQFLVTNYVSKP